MAKAKANRPPKDETKEAKFIRLANQRVGNALKHIGLVANLAGPGYERTAEQEKQITDALEAALQDVRDRFGGKSAQGGKFRLA